MMKLKSVFIAIKLLIQFLLSRTFGNIYIYIYILGRFYTFAPPPPNKYSGFLQLSVQQFHVTET